MGAFRRWRSGLVVTVVSFAVGTVRLVATGATDWLTWVWFLLAGLYAFAAVVALRLGYLEPTEERLGRLERRPRFATVLRGHETASGPDSDLARRIRYIQYESDESVTRNRIANALAVGAAVVGLVLVFSGAGQSGDETPGSPPTSSVAPAVPGPVR